MPFISNRFKLEEAIMHVWSTSEDLETLLRQYMDAEEPPSEDEMANALIGIRTLHTMKCDQLFSLFESMINNKEIL